MISQQTQSGGLERDPDVSALPSSPAPGSKSALPPRVLLIDEDEGYCREMHNYLTRHGFSVTTVVTGANGIHRSLAHPWELVILSATLPDIDGFEVLKRIRSHSSIPVLMLTGREDAADRVDALEFGADDYMPKTYSARELLAHIKAIIRRAGDHFPSKVRDNVLVIGELKVHLDAFRVFLRKTELPLTPVEYALLVSLARATGKVRSRQALFAEISARQSLTLRAVDVHVSTLRRKLGDTPAAPRYIQTSRGHGYMLVDPSPP